MDIARNDFKKLSIATAQKTLRFMQVRTTVSKWSGWRHPLMTAYSCREAACWNKHS